jgi:hypothetical protein
MPTRRTLLAAFGGGLVGSVGTYAGFEATDTGYGSIQWANERDAEVRVRTTVRSTGGLLADPKVVYESEYRIFPTGHTRGGDTNVVETGTYDVDVVVEAPARDEPIGPVSTTWTSAGCFHQRLIVRITSDLSVEFLQREC